MMKNIYSISIHIGSRHMFGTFLNFHFQCHCLNYMLLRCLEIGRSLKKDKCTLSSLKAGSKDTIFLLTPFHFGHDVFGNFV